MQIFDDHNSEDEEEPVSLPDWMPPEPEQTAPSPKTKKLVHGRRIPARARILNLQWRDQNISATPYDVSAGGFAVFCVEQFYKGDTISVRFEDAPTHVFQFTAVWVRQIAYRGNVIHANAPRWQVGFELKPVQPNDVVLFKVVAQTLLKSAA